MLEVLIDNIFVQFGGRLFQQTICIPMGTNHARYFTICFYMHMRQTSFKGFSRIKIEN